VSAQISVIIVNYNAGVLLRACVNSILSCPVQVEIIVVDNASKDDSLAGIQGMPSVQIIRNPVNVGFASGCNTGLRVSSAPHVLFLNPDCSFKPGALAELVNALDADPHVGMVGGLLTNMDGSEQVGARRAVPTPWRSFVRAFGLVSLSAWWPRLFFDFNLHKQPLPDHAVEVEAISGACMMVKRAALTDVGEWDEGYFLHCEDLDWCMRYRQKGWKILFVPSATITHVLGFCGRNRPVFVEWHKHKGMMRFYRKFFQEDYPGLLMVLVGAGVWLRFSVVAAAYLARRMVRLVTHPRG
jgi:GT2 family glycosyltransferase